MPIPIESYITVDDVKESKATVFESLVDGASDDFIQKRLNDLSRVIDEYCNTKFTPTQSSYKADLKSRNITPNKPLLSVQSVDVKGTLLAEDIDYYVYENSSLIEIENTALYDKKKKALTVEYTYGYDETPAIVKEVLLDLLRDTVSNLTQATGRVKSEQWDDYSYTLSDSSDVTNEILSRLDRFIEDEELEKSNNKIRAMLL